MQATLLMQPRTWLAFCAARANCWLLSSFSSTSYPSMPQCVFYPVLLLGCIVYYTCTYPWCKLHIQSLYFPGTLVILPTLWHRLDWKFVITYAYFYTVNRRGKDKRSVYKALLEDISSYSTVYSIRIHTWSTRQVRKLVEALFWKFFLRFLCPSHSVQNLKVQVFIPWLKDTRERLHYSD